MAKNKKYSREFKESVLRRLEEPTNEYIASNLPARLYQHLQIKVSILAPNRQYVE